MYIQIHISHVTINLDIHYTSIGWLSLPRGFHILFISIPIILLYVLPTFNLFWCNRNLYSSSLTIVRILLTGHGHVEIETSSLLRRNSNFNLRWLWLRKRNSDSAIHDQSLSWCIGLPANIFPWCIRLWVSNAWITVGNCIIPSATSNAILLSTNTYGRLEWRHMSFMIRAKLWHDWIITFKMWATGISKRFGL